MVPPTAPLNLDVEAISGICGSISIACWVVVFSPQILENFRRGSADGLSLHFVIVWLLGDVFNILGAVLQGVLPTMVILAVYYTIADIVLLGQCFYYRGFTWRDEVVPPEPTQRKPPPSSTAGSGEVVDERTALLPSDERPYPRERRGSDWSTLEHLSPAVPFVPVTEEGAPATPRKPPPTRLQSAVLNALAVLMVCGAGVAGWYLSRGYGGERPGDGGHREPGSPPENGGDDSLALNFWGQVFGYLCAVLYLGSRLPQLLLNWRRKSTEGVSMLFFLFACLGNLTYVMSIFAYEPPCAADGGECAPGEAARLYGRYMLVNLSWLAGSLGTLLLDMGIFAQFFYYNRDDSDTEANAEADASAGEEVAEDEDEDEDEEDEADEDEADEDEADEDEADEERSIDVSRWDQRPLLQRGVSNI